MQQYFFERFPLQIRRLGYWPADEAVRRQMRDDKVVFFGGQHWESVRDDLSAIPATDRPQFLLCLFMLVLADQTLQLQFKDLYPRWRQLTYIPKFGPAGAGVYNDHPLHILSAADHAGLIDLEFASLFVPELIGFMGAELERFVGEVLPEIPAARFFDRLMQRADSAEPQGPFAAAVFQELSRYAQRYRVDQPERQVA